MALRPLFDRPSATIKAPRGSAVTPTGRPRALPSSAREPETKSIGSPAGRPSRKGAKTTLKPTGTLRFQPPCSPTNTLRRNSRSSPGPRRPSQAPPRAIPGPCPGGPPKQPSADPAVARAGRQRQPRRRGARRGDRGADAVALGEQQAEQRPRGQALLPQGPEPPRRPVLLDGTVVEAHAPLGRRVEEGAAQERSELLIRPVRHDLGGVEGVRRAFTSRACSGDRTVRFRHRAAPPTPGARRLRGRAWPGARHRRQRGGQPVAVEILESDEGELALGAEARSGLLQLARLAEAASAGSTARRRRSTSGRLSARRASPSPSEARSSGSSSSVVVKSRNRRVRSTKPPIAPLYACRVRGGLPAFGRSC